MARITMLGVAHNINFLLSQSQQLDSELKELIVNVYNNKEEETIAFFKHYIYNVTYMINLPITYMHNPLFCFIVLEHYYYSKKVVGGFFI